MSFEPGAASMVSATCNVGSSCMRLIRVYKETPRKYDEIKERREYLHEQRGYLQRLSSDRSDWSVTSLKACKDQIKKTSTKLEDPANNPKTLARRPDKFTRKVANMFSHYQIEDVNESLKNQQWNNIAFLQMHDGREAQRERHEKRKERRDLSLKMRTGQVETKAQPGPIFISLFCQPAATPLQTDAHGHSGNRFSVCEKIDQPGPD